jgi:amino acid transporter
MPKIPLNQEEEATQPQPSLSLIDAVSVIVGIVVGAGIFKTPSQVAANVDSEMGFLLVWLGGGVVSLIGALCYGELATTYPHVGGEYHYLSRAFGKGIGWLFAWSRLVVMQTGSIALLAFVFGDYFCQLLPLGDYAPSIYAASAIILLSVFNGMGIKLSKWTQNCLSGAKLLGLLLIVAVGLTLTPTTVPGESNPKGYDGSYGLAIVFVLFTYGGWSEAAYIGAELHQVQRNMTRALVISITLITIIFFLVNLVYLKGLGLTALANSDVVAADLMSLVWGERGARLLSLLIAIFVLGATNGTIFTGARTNYALGQQEVHFSYLGTWHQRTHTPVNAIVVQGVIALILVLFGTLTRTGFVTMVEYTAPVFWFFLLLTGLSLLMLRYQEPSVSRPFRVPLYPFTPLLFCATCAYMLYASLTYTGAGALVGVVVLLTGIPLGLWFRHC